MFKMSYHYSMAASFILDLLYFLIGHQLKIFIATSIHPNI